MSIGLNVLLGHRCDARTTSTLPDVLHGDSALMQAVERHVRLAQPEYPALDKDALNARRWVFRWDDRARGPRGGGPGDGEAALEEGWATNNPVAVNGPALLVVDMGRHACDVGTPWRWWTLTDEAIYAAVQAVVRELARLLGSPAAIYVPDSAFAPSGARELVLEGATLGQIEEWLRERYGAPATDPASIIRRTQNKSYGFDMSETGYLKDTF